MTLPFDDYKLSWGDTEYIIPARQIMGAIAKVEQVITLSELQVYFVRGAAPLSLLAQAYGAVLRYAGAKVEDADVYAGMFGNGADDDAATNAAATVKTCLFGLLELMVPPAARGNLQKARQADAPETQQPPMVTATSKQPGGGRSSRKRSKRPSVIPVHGSSRRNNSGRSTQQNSTGGLKP